MRLRAVCLKVENINARIKNNRKHVARHLKDTHQSTNGKQWFYYRLLFESCIWCDRPLTVQTALTVQTVLTTLTALTELTVLTTLTALIVLTVLTTLTALTVLTAAKGR